MTSLHGTHPSLGAVMAAFRKAHRLTVKQLASRWQLPLDRVRALEHDATLPTSEEAERLALGLDELPHRVWRYVRTTALSLLEEALHPQVRATEAVAARHLPPGAEAEREAAMLLPVSLRTALCDAFQVPRGDAEALRAAWAGLTQQAPARQQIVLEAAVAQLCLEGEPNEGPLFP
jgi:hypothetical protein